MKAIALVAVLATMLTTSCMKSDMPEPCRTNTTCDSEFGNRPSCDTLVNKHPEQKTKTME
jgi:hypothetical protein